MMTSQLTLEEANVGTTGVSGAPAIKNMEIGIAATKEETLGAENIQLNAIACMNYV